MAPPRSHRLGAALKHVFQGAFFTLIIAPFIALPGVCAFAVFLAPPFFLGVLSNSRSSEMGLPEGWVRLNARFPLAIVLGIFVHLPIGFACLISVCGMLLLNAPALFTFELLGVLGMRFLWAAPPSTPDVENPKRRLAAGHAQSGGGAPDVRRIDVVEVPPSSDGGPTTSGRSDHNLGENSESSENGAAADVVELRARLEVMGLSTKGKRRELTDRYAEHTDPARYREFGAVWEALKGDSVRLVSLKWLMALAARGGVLQRRQDLPEAAFLSRQRLVAIEAKAAHGLDAEGLNEAVTKFVGGGGLRGLFGLLRAVVRRRPNVDRLLPIVAVSYCWLDAKHPDVDGHQLRLLCGALRRLYGGVGLLEACKRYGFEDMGVFLDFASLYQRDPELWRPWMDDPKLYAMSDAQLMSEASSPTNAAAMVAERRAYEGSRTPAQHASFTRALRETMDLWYGHAATTVVLHTVLPPAAADRARTYDVRGWCTFERCSAELAKSFKLSVAQWKLVIDTADEHGGAQRRLPTTPDRMRCLLAQRQFTNGADEASVLALYSRTATAVLGNVQLLSYLGLPLVCGNAWNAPPQLSAALNLCNHLTSLDLRGTRLTDEGLEALCAGLARDALPAITNLGLGCSRFGACGVGALCDALARGVAPAISILDLSNTYIGDESARVLAAALRTGQLPATLRIIRLDSSAISNAGATALAAALLDAPPACRLSFSMLNNPLGLRGQAALLHALEARHGLQLGHLPSVAVFTPWSLWPPGFQGLGDRRYLESGRLPP